MNFLKQFDKHSSRNFLIRLGSLKKLQEKSVEKELLIPSMLFRGNPRMNSVNPSIRVIGESVEKVRN